MFKYIFHQTSIPVSVLDLIYSNLHHPLTSSIHFANLSRLLFLADIPVEQAKAPLMFFVPHLQFLLLNLQQCI